MAAALDQFSYIFAIGTFFALLDVYNNGANDVANSWATSVSSRSIPYKWAMVCAFIFETLGATTVGARTADTIKNEIIPIEAFQGNAGVQMLAFTCALAGASMWVMWCTTHSAHVSSSYSLISAVAGVGVATAGASQVNWGWSGGKGLGAIFAGLFMAPCIAAGFGSTIFMLIKLTVHLRKNPVPWAINTSPFFFLIAGTICALSIVYKGSPNLGLADKPPWFIVAACLGTGGGLALLAFLFFIPYLYVKVVYRDNSLKGWEIIKGPLLWKRQIPESSERAKIPNYAVVQHNEEDDLPVVKKVKGDQKTDTDVDIKSSGDRSSDEDITATYAYKDEKTVDPETHQKTYKELVAEGRERFHARLRKKPGMLGWAMRSLHENQLAEGEIYETKNLKIFFFKRIPAMVVVALLYGLNYDIHAAQTGVQGTPEAKRMARTYDHAKKYANEVEHTYSFVQIITACTASFAHGANDIGNAAGPWAVIYGAWKTGNAAESESPVPVWQLAVLAITLSIGLMTYGFNIMKVMGNKITYHSPSRGCSMELGAAITVLIFSQYSLPVSTSMCITGATVGVGLCNGSFRAVNWQRVGLLGFAWLMTIPIAGTLAGVIMGIMLNTPHFVGVGQK